jgi:hypothetical protein
MTTRSVSIGHWYLGFGVFLILCGVAGYASNPAAAKTALISGGTFGILSAGWGAWMLISEGKAPRIAAGVTTLILIAAFTWRSVVSWQAVADGEPKRFAAGLISLMLVASIVSLSRLITSGRVQKG